MTAVLDPTKEPVDELNKETIIEPAFQLVKSASLSPLELECLKLHKEY